MSQPPNPRRHRNGGIPLDSPASPEGSGSFKQAGPLGGSTHSQRVPSRQIPNARTSPPAPPARSSNPATIGKDELFKLMYELLKVSEKDVPYLYADSQGNVTVGIGYLVAKKTAGDKEVRDALAKITLVHKSPSLQGCTGQVHEDHKFQAYKEVRARYEGKYNQVLSQGLEMAAKDGDDPLASDSPNAILGKYGKDPTSNKNKLPAEAYSKKDMPNLPSDPTNADLVLGKSESLRLLYLKLDEFYSTALKHFPDLKSYPINVQLVIIDIYYNGTGPKGPKGWFAPFTTAVRKRDWAEAAKHCSAGINKARDSWRRSQLESEARIQWLQQRSDLYGSLPVIV